MDYGELFADSSKFDEEFLINEECAHLVQQARKAMFIVLRKARKLNLPIAMQLRAI